MRTSDVTQLMDLALGLWFPFVRIMAFLRYVPVLDNSALTVRVRIILSLALAIIITPLIPHPIPHDLLSLNSLILTVEQILWGMLFGLMFQFPLITRSLIRSGIVSYRSVTGKRPHVIVGILLLAALLTPPDIVSQLMLAVPTYALFETSLFFSRPKQK